MGLFRVRGSFKIFPGVRLNYGKKGLTSASIGRGGLLSTNISKKGVKNTISVPGTGISYQSDHLSLSRPMQNRIHEAERTVHYESNPLQPRYDEMPYFQHRELKTVIEPVRTATNWWKVATILMAIGIAAALILFYRAVN